MKHNELKYLWVAVGVLVLAFIYLGFFSPRPNIVTNTLGSIVGPDFAGPYFSVNSLQDYVFSGTFKTGTTTLFSFATPNTSATYTVQFMVLDTTAGQNATSSYRIVCGTDANPSLPRIGANRPTNMFYTSPYYASSTSFFQVAQDATASPVFLGGTTPNFFCAARGTGDADSLGNCDATSCGWDNAFTNTNSTVGGTWKVRLTR